jgi:hypothetical protein
VTLATFAIDVTSIILRRRLFIAGWRVSASSNSLEADECLAHRAGGFEARPSSLNSPPFVKCGNSQARQEKGAHD